MKKLYLFLAAVMIIAVVKSQPGSDCSNAINLTPTNNLTYQAHTSSGKEYWIKFTAQSEYVNVSVKTKPYGNNQEHAHESVLLEGACGNLTEIKKDELAFVNYAEELSIDMNASGLVPGNTYYLKIDREAHTLPCDKSNCTSNNSSNPALFEVAIQNLSILVPIDFAAEKPPAAFHYEQNRGQLLKTDGTYATEIKLYNDKMAPAIYLGEDKASFVWSKIDNDSLTLDSLHRVDMVLVGSNPKPQIFRTENIETRTNYYLSHTAKGVHNKENYGRIIAKEVYNKIDMQLSSNNLGAKIFFTVQPGGNADDIVMQFDGATAVNITANKGLEVITPLGVLDFEAGHAYQVNAGNQVVPMPWQAEFISLGGNKVKLDIRQYPQNMPLFIQIDRGHAAPAATAAPKWCTFFGGSDNDYANDITVDNSGSIYIIGTTSSTQSSFPILNASQGLFKGDKDVFAAKFDFAYSQKWTTYYGGNNDDKGYGIAYSAADDKIYITGESSSSISTLITAALAGSPNSFVDNNQGGFIARLSVDQGLRQWATRFGGIGAACNKVKTDDKGNIYVVGHTSSAITPEFTCSSPANTDGRFTICDPGGGAYVQNYHGGGNSNYWDGFIAKFNSATELNWSTFFGGSGDWDEINSIAIDNTNNQIYIAGSTNSPLVTPYSTCTPPANGSFPLCEGAGGYYQDQVNADNNFSLGPFTDAFIAKFTASGILEWSSFFGAYNEDYGTDIAVNSLGQVYITGYTNSNQYTWTFCQPPVDGSIGDEGFPRCYGSQSYMQNFSNGGANNGFEQSWDAFIAKFDYPVPDLLWSSFIGGDRAEKNTSVMYTTTDAPKIAIDYNDRVHMSGITRSGCYVGDETAPLAQNPLYYYQPQGHADNAYDINCSAMDGFVASFNADDSPYLGTYFGGLGNDFAAGIAVFLDRIYVVGGSYSTSQFPLSCPTDVPNPYCQGYTTVSASKHDAFIAQIRASNVQLSVESKPNQAHSCNIFPNPSSGRFTVENLPVFSGKVNITVYNALGQEVFEKEIFSGNKQISLPVLSDGLYFIKINSGKNTFYDKILIQR